MEKSTSLISIFSVVLALASVTGCVTPGAGVESRRTEIAQLEADLDESIEVPTSHATSPRVVMARERLVERLRERRAALEFFEQLQSGAARDGGCPALARIPVEGAVFAGALGRAVRPADGRMRLHEGLDMSAPTGTPVYAAYDGTVAVAGERGGYGNAVYLDHGWGSTRYAHLDSIAVYPGTRVLRGQEIGRLGATGLAGSPHLHFEVRHADGTVIDPLSCL